jgi:hypothetical protein
MAALSPQHDRLAAIVGAWEGTATTWTAPHPHPPDVSPWRLTIAPMLGGRFFEQRHWGRFGGEELEGVLIYGFDTARGVHTATWFDSFHTGTAQLVMEGPPPVDALTLLDVRGRYYVKEADASWGWRMVLRTPASGALRIEMFNVDPSGTEYPAVAVVLARRA